MTDSPQEQVAEALSAAAAHADTPMQGASEENIAVQVAQGQAAADLPIGAAHVDIAELLAQITAYKASTDARIAALEAEKRAAGGSGPLPGVLTSLRDLVATHAAHTPSVAHGEVLNLVEDLGEAVKGALGSGDMSHVTAIGRQVERWLQRNPPPPGDNPYFAQALDFAGPHLVDAVAATPPPVPAVTGVIGSDRSPAKVVAGNVTAG